MTVDSDCGMSTRFLINDDGAPFDPTELEALRNELDALNDKERERFRDQNALAIAQHDCDKILVRLWSRNWKELHVLGSN